MVYNVFQPSFKLKANIRGKFFSVIWDIECCVLVSSQPLVTIKKSLWLPFRFSDYKTGQFPTNVILRTKDLLRYLFVSCNPDGNLIKMSCQSFISTGYHTTSCTLPLLSFQELNSNSRLFTILQYLFYIKISHILVHPKHFCHRKLMFWSFTRSFRIPCSTW